MNKRMRNFKWNKAYQFFQIAPFYKDISNLFNPDSLALSMSSIISYQIELSLSVISKLSHNVEKAYYSSYSESNQGPQA